MTVLEILQYDFMRHALLASLLVGLAAPVVGIFLVQRRLALIGDGMGHVALAGVALGILTDQQPVWTALLAAVVGAIAIELVRARGRTSGDIALAVLFYGGIAGGVVLISLSPSGTPANLNAYLFGAITTTSTTDLVTFAALAGAVLVTAAVLAPRLFAVSNDPEYARAVGLPVLPLNLTLAVLTAVTVVVSMRIVGLLLISALMILPNAISQLVCHSFRTSLLLAVATGVVVSVAGVTTSFYASTPSGGTIVLFAVGVFVVVALVVAARDALARRRHAQVEGHAEHEHHPGCGHPAVVHDDHVDYLHGGHRHAQHAGHYDEHGPA
ncbi:MAG TPA: metal ABC transporter permease [Actinomycetales bacterium]|nr:metal ABC transporter permease [Actinomycetales bacterium]